MALNRRALLLAGAGALVAGCSGTEGLFQSRQAMRFSRPSPLVPLKLNEGRLMRMTVCTRPFRARGPRLEIEKIDGKSVVHNYGHGGSGWSLSWGCAAEAAGLALGCGAQSFAVIGAGAMGLTTALRLVETGAQVTLYAREFPAETRSARATGVWSPSSRIGLADAVASGFDERWERWARFSYAQHQHYIGTVGAPVEFIERYTLRDQPRRPYTPPSRDFLRLDRQVRDLYAPWADIPETDHPFQGRTARGGMMMAFNVTAYSDRLSQDFLLRGGRMVRRDFADTSEILALPEPVIINCTGYDAKRLWGDQTLEPVRGQINWLAPQPEAHYGFYYNSVSVLSRGDGIVVQYTGPNDDYGFGDDSEMADRQELEKALKTVAPLFEPRSKKRGSTARRRAS